VLKTHSLLITTLYSIALTIVSLVQLKDMPDFVPTFADKIFHFITYSILVLLWFKTFSYTFKIKRLRAIIWAGLVAITFGTFIEVLQGEVTNSRVFDLNDISANILGILLTVFMLVILKKTDVKK